MTHNRAPISDSIIVAVAHLVDDSQTASRLPSHSEIGYSIQRAGLSNGDPNSIGQTAGKAKRVRSCLTWALDNAPESGERFIALLVSTIGAVGGFRKTSQNYVGEEAFVNAKTAFRKEGFNLTSDGELTASVLDNLSGVELTEAIEAYIRRAKRGIDDVALVTGTGKDLLEATAAHVLLERNNSYSTHSNFAMLLGQAFIALGMATSADPVQANESPQREVDRKLFDLGCAVNRLRNKEGTGHGRPWLPEVTDDEARTALEIMGVIAERLLAAHKAQE